MREQDKEPHAMNNERPGDRNVVNLPRLLWQGRDTMNIEVSGGLIYEIVNAGNIFNLKSGTKVILPPGTEITANSKIDLKGGKLQLYIRG
eukprot:scaffold17227_cov136-Skeletonema_marinoi.AAC.7